MCINIIPTHPPKSLTRPFQFATIFTIQLQLPPLKDFDDLLTVHLSIFISVINQFDAQNFTISLFHASTRFEHHVLIIRRSKLYYTRGSQ
jgi:hypothetical protein